MTGGGMPSPLMLMKEGRTVGRTAGGAADELEEPPTVYVPPCWFSCTHCNAR